MPTPPPVQLVFKFGPWAAGLVNSVDQYFIPPEALLRADNILIDQRGRAEARKKWDLLDSANYKSLYEFGGLYYGVRNNELGVVAQDSFTAITSVAGPVHWTVLDGKLVYTDFSVNKIVNGFSIEALPTGYYDGDEESRYQFEALPAGSFIAAWNGRLLVVRGRNLYWSEPIHYGVYSATRGYYRCGEAIQWAAPLSTGVYLGLKTTVIFLAGSDPNTFTRRTVGTVSAPGAAAVFDSKYSGNSGELALWFTDVGVALGKPDGTVVYPQAERLKNLPLQPGSLVVQNDRVFVLTTAES